uniref:C2 domain-containing protein n=1 Tax=Chenopodium quinoa TaxID=63459 RepID=A0A803L5W3_CHEQI
MSNKHNQQVNPPPPMEELSPKKTSPNIPSTKKSMASAFSLVEPMEFLYIRIVKGKDPCELENDTDTFKTYVEVRIGNYRAITKPVEKTANPEWNQVFAFSKERIHTFFIEILMKKKDKEGEGVKGRLIFDVNEAPKRVPPDSPLAPQWYILEDLGGVCVKEELMVAVWMGTQADEAFTEAWNLDAAGVSYEDVVNTKAKVYMSPKLWYLRVNVIQAQNLEIANKNKKAEVFVKAVFGDAMARTKFSTSKNVLSPMWNEDLMFVAAEPFEHLLVLTVVTKVGNNEEVVGKCVIHLGKLERRLGSKPVDARWYSLERPGENCKIQLRASLDGGYHVLDETARHSSDTRPTVRQLWKQEIGVLELGILNATGLPQMKMRSGHQGRTDAY